MDSNFELEDEENRASLKNWILQTFKKRECVKYVRCSRNTEKCGCGKLPNDHIEQSIFDYGKIWKIQENTKLFQTDAFGTLEFQGADTHTMKAEYIRLSFDTKPQHIFKLLKSYWQLELPKLIISVHGGIANFTLQTKLKQAIERGIIKVADTSRIWIITAGTDTGVVKHIGDILKNNFPKYRNNIIAIGIAPWGVVSGKDLLKGCDNEVSYYANQVVNYGNMVNLNSCHSYFLLVDDGTNGKYGCEISFRRRLERFLSRHKSEISMDFDLKPTIIDVTIEEKISLQNYHTIPLLCLVIEGGTNTIQTVLVNVNDKPAVPVVVCDGSGRAADLLAFTHKYVYSVNKKLTMDVDVKEQLINTIMKTFFYCKEQAETLFSELLNCVKNKELVSIYRFGDDFEEIDVAILTASLKIVDIQLSKQLDLIMSWNRPDIAKKYINLVGNNAEKATLEEKMFDALCQDKVEFVQLLLEYGVNLQKFLNYKRLQDLYNCKKGPTNTLLLIIKDVVKRFDNNYVITLPDIGLVVEKLIGGGYVSEYSKRSFKLKYIKFLEKNFNISGPDAPSTDTYVFKYPYNELLIWAILMKRHKMAMFVCKRGEETLAKALVASKLNKALAREAELDDLDNEVSDEFKGYSDEFANLAYGILDRCYKEDDELTNQLLTYDLVNWSHWTCITLAVSCNLKEFLAHVSCQLLLNDLWMGGMKIRKHATYKIIAALLFPPAIFAITFKSVKELQYMPQTQEEHEKDYLDNQSLYSSSSLESIDNLQNSIQLEQTRNNQAPENILNMDRFIEEYDEKTYLKRGIKKIPNGDIESVVTNRERSQSTQLYDRHKKTINIEVKRKTNKLRFGKKLYEFYNAPITKFWQDTILYIIFLMSLTYIVLVKTPPTPSAPEIVVLVYVFSFGFDKIREILQTDSPRFSGKLRVFFSKIMNVMDLFFISTFIIALGFRLSTLENASIVARLIYCVNSIYWCVRLLEFLLINKYVGVLIIIASKMLIDLFNFVVILLIVLMSFGVSRQAIKFPNEDFSWSSVKMIFLEPYFMLYGEVYAPDIDPGCNTSLPLDDQPGCMPGHWITPLTMTIFMIVANLLLLSILLASFNNTYTRISKQSAQVWKCQRYHIITSYESKPLLAPPFVIFSHIFMIFKYLIRICRKSNVKYDHKLKSFLSDDMIQRLHNFEERCFHAYDHFVKISANERLEEKINHTAKKVDNMSARIDDIFFKENLTKLSLYKTELRLQKLEEITFELNNQLSDISQNIKKDDDQHDFITALGKSNRIRRRILSESQASYAEYTMDDAHKQIRTTISVDRESNTKSPPGTPNGSKVSLATVSPNQVLRLQSQISNAFDQYTSNPGIYLHPVVKPPLNEYTSITDCIDTSEIDRPASPKLITSQIHSSQDDHYVAEPSRRAIARQETEILRLAEESQHVIISQMLNKMVKSDARLKKEQFKQKDKTITEISDEYPSEEQQIEVVQNDDNKNSNDKLTASNVSKLMNQTHRNSSQIWFVESEADALCLDLNEDENDIVL